MGLFSSLEVSGSALTAERQRADLIAANLANVETTRTQQGGPYRRQLAVFRSGRQWRFPELHFAALVGGMQDGLSPRFGEGPMVRVANVVSDPTPPLQRYEPGHPDADAKGYVSYPSINPVEETADLMAAARAYELNSSAVQATKGMIQQALDLLLDALAAMELPRHRLTACG